MVQAFVHAAAPRQGGGQQVEGGGAGRQAGRVIRRNVSHRRGVPGSGRQRKKDQALADLDLVLKLRPGLAPAIRMRALLLVPIVLVPLSLATLVLVFGRQTEAWLIDNAGHELRYFVILLWRLVRWAISLLTSITVLGALYHFGTQRKEHWAMVAPGAVAATLVWFPATLAFGWYVTRIADYSMFYGSFGAGIATLVWLYITSFSALLGAELNGVLFREREEQASISVTSEPVDECL